MPDRVKEKLVELLDDCVYENVLTDDPYDGFEVKCGNIADHLIAHGVTVQEWISVTERLPDTIPCGAGTAYSEAVYVLTDGRKVLTAIWNGLHWICDAEFWDAEFEEITHWTPVLLPLPQPPKGE